MIFDVVTLFPGMFQGPLDDGMLARARRAGRVAVRVHDLRRWGVGPQRQVDDAPFGGGAGMVLKPEPFFEAVAWIREQAPRAPDRVILLSPQGAPLDHAAAKRLAGYERLVLLCGRYEGVDDRVREALVDEEVSVGDVVLTGGELGALLVIDAVSRLVPGVLGNAASAADESFAAGRLDWPSFTRPADYRGRAVPEVLLSGDHAAIARWRAGAAGEATRAKRPDLIDSTNSTSASRGRQRGPS
jgi:tRNA (guanine37-N1)-methyltransferase